ncbi:MAG: DUF362 domain-containing protein [Clostridiales bacterium]|nr:DUF362 domain-containing protein [Clostridiales bacterium]
MIKNQVAAKGGEKYVPYSERSGNSSTVFFTRDLSPEGLCRIYDRICGALSGKIAVKLHTGEKNGPNIIPSAWVKQLMNEKLQGGVIVETNTYYDGDRYTTKRHRETLKVNGWDFCKVDILDEDGTAMFKINGGKWFNEMSVGKNLQNYDSLLVLTHFKGHAMGGFGGSNKNIGIGCADGRVGKGMIHTSAGSDDMWDINTEELMERITESTKSVTDHFGKNIAFINVMRNMSVSCDCEGCGAEPVVTPDIGIVASLDILAADQASVDLVHALVKKDRAALVKRIESRHGYRQLSYMKELGMGNDLYPLIDIDNGDKEITAASAVLRVNKF